MKSHNFNSMYSYPMPYVKVALFHSADKLMRRMAEGHVNVNLDRSKAACMFPITFKNDDRVYIVYLNMEKMKDLPLWEQLETLAHEAVHVAATYFDDISEDKPGEEEFSYVCGTAAGMLFDIHLNYLENKDKKKKNKKKKSKSNDTEKSS